MGSVNELTAKIVTPPARTFPTKDRPLFFRVESSTHTSRGDCEQMWQARKLWLRKGGRPGRAGATQAPVSGASDRIVILGTRGYVPHCAGTIPWHHPLACGPRRSTHPAPFLNPPPVVSHLDLTYARNPTG